MARIGGYGFVLRLELGLDRPARALRAHLDGLKQQPAAFGRLQSPARFVANQVWLRVRKRPAGQASRPQDAPLPDVEAASDHHAGPPRAP
jgi:hypothetical protein